MTRNIESATYYTAAVAAAYTLRSSISTRARIQPFPEEEEEEGKTRKKVFLWPGKSYLDAVLPDLPAAYADTMYLFIDCIYFFVCLPFGDVHRLFIMSITAKKKKKKDEEKNSTTGEDVTHDHHQ
ncbi:MAG: hypothetical protein ABJM37_09670 [Gilvibacter sp.]